MPTAYILHGLPCSGKTTYYNKHLSHLKRVSMDDYIDKLALEKGITYNQAFELRTKSGYKAAKKDLLDYTANSDDFCIDMTNLTGRDRLIPDNYALEHIWMPLDSDKIVEWNKREGKIISNKVFQQMLQSLCKNLEHPYSQKEMLKACVTFGLIKANWYNGLATLKYTRDAMYKGYWNLYTRNARGMVIDEDYNIVSAGLEKTFNYGVETEELPLSTAVYADVKINGFMAGVTWHKGELVVTTTGTLNSDYACLARKYLMEMFDKAVNPLDLYVDNPNYTFFYEIVAAEDPHIIKEEQGCHFLGCRRKELTSEFIMATQFNCAVESVFEVVPPQKTFELDYILAVSKTLIDSEGFMVKDIHTKQIFKVKTLYYLAAKKLARAKDVESALAHCSKHFSGPSTRTFLEAVYEKTAYFTSLDEQARLAFIRGVACQSI